MPQAKAEDAHDLASQERIAALALTAISEPTEYTAVMRVEDGGYPDLDIVLGKSALRIAVGRTAVDELLPASFARVLKSYTPLGNKTFKPAVDLPCTVVHGDNVFDGERDGDGRWVVVLGKGLATPGVHLEDEVELWLESSGPARTFSGRLVVKRDAAGQETATIRTGADLGTLLPRAVDLSKSYLPRAVEQTVPEALRWWTLPLAKQANARDTFISMVDEMSVVNGYVERVSVKTVRYRYRLPDAELVEADASDAIASVLPFGKGVSSPLEKAESWREALDSVPPDHVVFLDPPDPDEFPAERLTRMVTKRANDWLLCTDDTPEAREAFAKVGEPFHLDADALAGRLFVASYPILSRRARPLVKAAPVEPAKSVEFTKNVETLLDKTRVIKAAESDERFVYGVVLEPNSVDSQNDTIDEAEIRKAAHTFMAEFRNLGLQHQVFINGSAQILESFVAPCDFEVNGEPVRKGSWMFGVRVLDDLVWSAVKAGSITGFSIGGSGRRVPVDSL